MSVNIFKNNITRGFALSAGLTASTLSTQGLMEDRSDTYSQDAMVFFYEGDDFSIHRRGNEIHFEGPINDASINTLLRYTENIVRNDPETDIDFTFDSKGGSVDAGQRFIKEMQNLDTNFTVRCEKVASMAFMIFIDENLTHKIAHENCQGMFHFSYFVTNFSEEAQKNGAPEHSRALRIADYQEFLNTLNETGVDELDIPLAENSVRLSRDKAVEALTELNETQEESILIRFSSRDTVDLKEREISFTAQELEEYISTIDNHGSEGIRLNFPPTSVTYTRQDILNSLESLQENRQIFSEEFARASILSVEDVLSFGDKDVRLSAAQMYALGLVESVEGGITNEETEEALDLLCDEYIQVSICSPE
ncbi:MAG: ATP-dependent Clp protease proteolytic subunit [Alphaproteobacteria bacterium]